MATDSNNYFSPLVSDDSESSYEDCELSNVHIKTEPAENDTDIKIDDQINEEGGQIEERIEIKIKHEIVDDKMDFEEANDIAKNNDIEYDENVGKAEVLTEEIEIEKEKTVNEENVTGKGDEGKIDQEDQTELQTVVNINPLVKIKQEEDNSSEKFSIERRRKKPKKDISESEQTSKIEARKPIKIKQEPVDSDPELDPSEDIIDGVKRELRPRKLNEPNVYFEPYDGSTSEGSDLTDLSD